MLAGAARDEAARRRRRKTAAPRCAMSDVFDAEAMECHRMRSRIDRAARR
jgi:hypothetical protein